MDPKNTYYERAAATIIKNLEKRRMKGYYCPTGKEAAKFAMSFVKPGMSVSNGGSMTLDEIGFLDMLRKRDDIHFLDRAEGKTPEEQQEIMHRALLCDCYFLSTNAITMDGELVNIDGTGNRMAAFIYGPKEVIVVAGMNKVVSDIPSAYARIKDISTPQNCIRLGKKSPCAVNGRCGDCMGDESICSQLVVTRRTGPAGRIQVILVGEELGY